MSQTIEPRMAQETEQIVQSEAGIERHERVVSDAAGVEHREQFVQDVAGEQWFQLIRAVQLIWLFFGILEALMGLRVLLKLIGANPNNDFAHFVYTTAGVFLAPFFGLIGSPVSGTGVLELPSVIAMVAYGFLGWGVVRAVWLVFNRPVTRSASTYDRHQA